MNGASRWATRTTTARAGARRTCPRGDRKALLALPETRFDVVTWKRMKADKYGIVTVEGRHRYAAGPEHAGRELIVGLRAFEVELLDASGARITTHPRAYGDNPTSSDDPSLQIGLLCNRPGAWPNSQVREALPDPLVFCQAVVVHCGVSFQSEKAGEISPFRGGDEMLDSLSGRSRHHGEVFEGTAQARGGVVRAVRA